MTIDRRLDRVVQVAVPIVTTTILAIGVLVAVPRTGAPGVPNGSTDVDPGVVVADAALPVSDLDRIVSAARAASGEAPRCTGPWTTGKVLNWACRTHDVLVILRGRSRTAIEELDMTWFGFDPARSVLPAWAGAVATGPENAEGLSDWARAVSGSDGQTIVGRIQLVAGGSRGAISLVVAGLACATESVGGTSTTC